MFLAPDKVSERDKSAGGTLHLCDLEVFDNRCKALLFMYRYVEKVEG